MALSFPFLEKPWLDSGQHEDRVPALLVSSAVSLGSMVESSRNMYIMLSDIIVYYNMSLQYNLVYYSTLHYAVVDYSSGRVATCKLIPLGPGMVTTCAGASWLATGLGFRV